VLKFANLCIFSRRRTTCTIGAPPVGEIYRAEYMFRRISIPLPAHYQTAENHISRYSTFSAKGGQNGNKRQNRTLSVLREIF